MNYYLPTQYPTAEQEEMNNGMTELKLRILRYNIKLQEYGRKEGQVSAAQCYTSTLMYIRDMEILKGKEPAYLQG